MEVKKLIEEKEENNRLKDGFKKNLFIALVILPLIVLLVILGCAIAAYFMSRS